MKKKKIKREPVSFPLGALDKIRSRAENLASENDLQVHDVTFGPTDMGLTLSVVIKCLDESPRALSVTDCELVSRPLSRELDDLLENFEENYLFEVTSVGIDKETC